MNDYQKITIRPPTSLSLHLEVAPDKWITIPGTVETLLDVTAEAYKKGFEDGCNKTSQDLNL